MAATKDSYRIIGRTPEEIVRELNFVLARLADRIDKAEGIRGTAAIASDLDMNSNRVVDVGPGSDSADAARVGDLLSDGPIFASVTTTADMAVGGDVSVGGNIYVYDADDNLIHSME